MHVSWSSFLQLTKIKPVHAIRSILLFYAYGNALRDPSGIARFLCADRARTEALEQRSLVADPEGPLVHEVAPLVRGCAGIRLLDWNQYGSRESSFFQVEPAAPAAGGGSRHPVERHARHRHVGS